VSDVTFATNFLNISYVDGDLVHLASVRANPSIKLFDIKEAGGASVESRFMLRGAAGMSGNLTDAQSIAAQNKNGRHYRWQVPFGKTRGSFRIPYEDIMASKLDEAAEAKALELEMEKGSAECGSKLVQLLFGRSGLAGGFGEYEETASGDFPSFAIRFSDPSDARNFQPGDNVVIAAGTGESAQSLVGDVGYVYDSDVEDGFIRVAALADPDTPANPGGWVDDTNYYLFNLGIHGNGSHDQHRQRRDGADLGALQEQGLGLRALAHGLEALLATRQRAALGSGPSQRASDPPDGGLERPRGEDLLGPRQHRGSSVRARALQHFGLTRGL
jgi:hypothetical protein